MASAPGEGGKERFRTNKDAILIVIYCTTVLLVGLYGDFLSCPMSGPHTTPR